MSDREAINALVTELEQLVPESFDGVDVVNYHQVRDIITAIRRLEKERDVYFEQIEHAGNNIANLQLQVDEARNKALDEAARIASTYPPESRFKDTMECQVTAESISDRILALKTKEPKP